MNNMINKIISALLLWSAIAHIPALAAAGIDTAIAATTFPTRLYLSKEGVALSRFPSHTGLLKRTLKVTRTSGNAPVSWSASSDQSWLTVTPSGTAPGTLVLQAEPKGLTKDQLYLATVTVSTTGDGDFVDTQTVRVSLWISAKNPINLDFKHDVAALATNPVLPYVYVSAGDATVDVYNVYTGRLVTKFPRVAPTIGALTVSGDGKLLFAADYTNYRIVKLDAANGAKLDQFEIGQQIGYGFSMAYARPFGVPAIYPSGGRIFSVETNMPLTSIPLPGEFIAVTPNGRKIYTVDIGMSPGSLTGYLVTDNAGTLAVKSFGSNMISGENCQDLAVSENGEHVYPACGYPYEFDVYSGKTLQQVQTLPAAPYPNNAEIDATGRFVGGINGIYEDFDVFVYTQNGYSVGKVPTMPDEYATGQNSNLMVVSGDAFRVISAVSPFILFRNLP